MAAAKVNVGAGSSTEGAVDLTACAPVRIPAQEDTLDLTADAPKTPNDQLRKVYDLSKESTNATYEWMRLVSCKNTQMLFPFLLCFPFVYFL